MSRPPGRIMADIAIDLPRPRRFEMLTDPTFATYKREVLALDSIPSLPWCRPPNLTNLYFK